MVASFVIGLREDSRFQLKLQNSKTSLNNFLLAGILDRLSLLVYSNTKDAQKGINKPKLLINTLIENTNIKTESFNSGEDFKKEREKILKNIIEKGCDDIE